MRQAKLYSHGQAQKKIFTGGFLAGFLAALLCFGFWNLAIKSKLLQKDQNSQTETQDSIADSTAMAEEPVINADDNDSEIIRTTYIVKQGDTLSKIAAAHNTTTNAILILNELDDADKIFVGQELVVKDVLPTYYYALIQDNVMKLITNKVDGSGEEMLMSAKVFDADPGIALNQDRTQILYTESPLSGGKGAQTFVANIDGSNRQEVISADLSLPAKLGQMWSQDGQKIAYAFENNLWIYDLGTQEKQLVCDTLAILPGDEPGYAWHSKSTKLAYVSLSGDGLMSIFIYDLESSGKTPAADLEGKIVSQIAWPYGNAIYFLALSPSLSRVEVYRLLVSSSLIEQVTHNDFTEEHAIFRSDKDEFVFAVNEMDAVARQQEKGIWFFDAGGQQKQLFSTTSGACEPLSFDKSGENLFFAQGENTGSRIYRVQIESLQITLLQQGQGIVFFGD